MGKMTLTGATATGTSVRSVASAVRNMIEPTADADAHHRTTPADEWFNRALSKIGRT